MFQTRSKTPVCRQERLELGFWIMVNVDDLEAMFGDVRRNLGFARNPVTHSHC